MIGKSKKKKNEDKESKLVVRVEESLRDAFVERCRDLDTTASREVRRFIRDFLKAKEDPETNDVRASSGSAEDVEK